jgi:hypothetical protein
MSQSLPVVLPVLFVLVMLFVAGLVVFSRRQGDGTDEDS